MTFDWRKFFDKHGIEVVERGPSTARGNIYVKCPFCAEADQGHHLGVSEDNVRGWGCWKDNRHRGRAPQRLIQALLRCSWQEAARIAGIASSGPQMGAGALLAAVQQMLGKAPAEPERQSPQFPREVRKLDFQPMSREIRYYLRDRDYADDDIRLLIERFDLRYAMSGDWGYRLILPIYDERTRLLTWTGRAITETAKVRYKTLTASPEKAGDGPLALAPIPDCLMGLPDLFEGGEFLVIGEGPFDGFRLSLAADPYDAKATCLFGKVISASQLDLLVQLRPFYKAIFLLLDPDAAPDALRMGPALRMAGVQTVPLRGDCDPDEMKGVDLGFLMAELAQRAGVREIRHA